MRNCLNQLIAKPGVASAMFEYRFNGSGELAGHNLGNLMLKALDHLSVRPLEAINLIRNLLKVDAFLIPMSEQPVDLVARDTDGQLIFGETDIDLMAMPPQELMLSPAVSATREAVEAIGQADLILIGPGSFFTSLMPVLLLPEIAQALRRTPATMVFIGNLGKELSPAAAGMTTVKKLEMMEKVIGKQVIDALLLGPCADSARLEQRLVFQQPLEAADIPYRHDRQLLRMALERAVQSMG